MIWGIRAHSIACAMGQLFAKALPADFATLAWSTPGYDLILVARNRERLESHASRLKAETGRSIEVVAAARAAFICELPRRSMRRRRLN